MHFYSPLKFLNSVYFFNSNSLKTQYHHNSSGNPVIKNPDTQDTATGGFNPAAGGQGTQGVDNSFYIGEAGLVTRVSRVHTIWFDTTESGSSVFSPTFAQPFLEPNPDQQPFGTSVVLAFRGATNISGLDTGGSPPDDITTNSLNLDFYGDAAAGTGTPSYIDGAGAWQSDITAINSSRYFQARISFISNAASSKTAELTSMPLSSPAHWVSY
jgi:hypothetical protein